MNTAPHHSIRPWIAIITLALSIFTVVSTEMLPIGLLSPIAASFQVSEGEISLIVSLPALVAAFAAPLILLLFSKTNRKYLLVSFMLLLCAANIFSSIAPNIAFLLFARILLGVSMGGIWTIAGGLAVRIVETRHITLATSIIFSGVAAASVFGIPIGVYLGDLLSWELAFICMTGLTIILIILMLLSLPPLPSQSVFDVSTLKVVLKRGTVWTGIIITFLLVAGHFTSYTFIRPLLQTQASFSESSIGGLLFIYGLLGIIGNFLLGNLTGRYLKSVVLMIAGLLTLCIILFQFFAHLQSISTIILLLWGFAYGAVSVSLMTWMFRLSPNSIEAMTAIYIGMFNLAIAAGSYLGGWLYDSRGISSVLIVGSIMTFLAFIVTLRSTSPSNAE